MEATTERMSAPGPEKAPGWAGASFAPGFGWRPLAVALTAAALLMGAPAQARDTSLPGQSAQAETVSLAVLPPEASTTHRLILAGGPFPYQKDGTIFFNRERLLPQRPRGQYREYTVKTPGARNRGARRIVCSGLPPTAPEACYYTSDHYASFQRIAP